MRETRRESLRASPDGPSAGGGTDEAAGPGGERGRGGGGEGTDGTHDDGGGPAGSRAAGWERRSPRGAGRFRGRPVGVTVKRGTEAGLGRGGKRVTSSSGRRGCCSFASVSCPESFPRFEA